MNTQAKWLQHAELSWDTLGYYHSQKKICLLKNMKRVVKRIWAPTPTSIIHKVLIYILGNSKRKIHLKF